MRARKKEKFWNSPSPEIAPINGNNAIPPKVCLTFGGIIVTLHLKTFVILIFSKVLFRSLEVIDRLYSLDNFRCRLNIL